MIVDKIIKDYFDLCYRDKTRPHQLNISVSTYRQILMEDFTGETVRGLEHDQDGKFNRLLLGCPIFLVKDENLSYEWICRH